MHQRGVKQSTPEAGTYTVVRRSITDVISDIAHAPTYVCSVIDQLAAGRTTYCVRRRKGRVPAGVLSHVMRLRGAACLLCLLSLSTLHADVAVEPKYVVAVSRRNATIADAGTCSQPAQHTARLSCSHLRHQEWLHPASLARAPWSSRTTRGSGTGGHRCKSHPVSMNASPSPSRHTASPASCPARMRRRRMGAVRVRRGTGLRGASTAAIAPRAASGLLLTPLQCAEAAQRVGAARGAV